MEYRVLGKTGLKVSALSFGASSLGNAFRQINKSDGLKAVHVSLDNGINLLDVSPFYGLTTAETTLGQALAGVPRPLKPGPPFHQSFSMIGVDTPIAA